jgi:hypothetical protein
MTFMDNKGVVLLQRTLQDPQGSVATVVPADAKGGQYKVCLKCPGSRWTADEPQKFRVKIDVGGRSLLDTAESAAKADDVRYVETKAKAVLERIGSLTRDSEYERVTESMWRAETEKTSSSLRFLSVMSICVMMVVSVIQVLALKNFFKKEKLIF